MTRTERDRPAALAASEASQAAIKRETALRDAAPELLEVLKRIADPRNIHFAGDAQVVAREQFPRRDTPGAAERAGNMCIDQHCCR